jgi:hypothetical protein
MQYKEFNMGTILRNENISELSLDSTTVISLPSSVITIGGQQFSNSSSISMDITTSGTGGLDTGSVAADTVYFIHAVVSSGTMFLVASTSETSPTGFSQFKRIGRCITNGSSELTSLATYIKEDETNWSTFTPFDFSTTVTTPPTKGPITFDQIQWREIDGMYEVQGQLEMSAAGAVGAGEYTLLLPCGIEIDSTKQPIGVGFGALNGMISTPRGLLESSGFGVNTASDSDIQAAAFSTTELKFIVDDHNSPSQTWSSSFFQFNQATAMAFKCRFHGLGL